MEKISFVPLFALSAMASMLGLYVTSPTGFSPAYFWLVIVIFLMQAVSIFIFVRADTAAARSISGQYIPLMQSSFMGKSLLIIFGIALVLRVSLTLSFQTDCIGLYLLEDTPNFAVTLILITTVYIALIPGLRRLSGVSVLLLILTAATIVLMTITGFISADLRELRLLAQPSSAEFSGAVIPAAITASGAECIMLFLNSFDRGKKHIYVAAAPVFCALIFAILCCVSVGTTGLGGMEPEQFPVVEASRQINLGGIELTERFDLPLISVSIFAALAQMAIYTLCASYCFCIAFGIPNRKAAAPVLLPLIIAASLMIQYTSIDRIFELICAVVLTAFCVVLFPVSALLSLTVKKEALKA